MDEFNLFGICLAFCFALGFFFGLGVGSPSDQTRINAFRGNPVCVAETVGLENIKKCYKLQEVK